VLPDEHNAMLRGFQTSRAVLTAVELDLFTAVGDGASAAEVAARLKTAPRATESLLNALTALGLLEKQDGRFRNGDWAARFLCAGAVHDSRAALMHSVHLWPRWSTLTDCVRRGTAVSFEEMAERNEDWTDAFIAAMHKNATARARPVVAALDLEGVKQVLDLGGGSGAYAMAFARALPEVEVTVFDLPTVTPLTRRYVAESGLEQRIHTRNGDLRTDSYGTGGLRPGARLRDLPYERPRRESRDAAQDEGRPEPRRPRRDPGLHPERAEDGPDIRRPVRLEHVGGHPRG
jgi:hypothetical protein